MPLPDGLTRLVHQRTSGNPLFVATIIEELIKRHVIEEGAAGWAWSRETAAITLEAPESLRHLIERQLAQLPPAERTLLEAASVVGIAFAAAAVAAATDISPDEVETRLVDLARHHHLIKMHGTAEWRDGTVTVQCVFMHDLYREVIYRRVPAGRRVRWHRQIGARLESAYGTHSFEIAAELAVHFTRGRADRQALLHLQQAAQNASRRHAHREAISHLTTGLDLLQQVPDLTERLQTELPYQIALGRALTALKGYSAPEVQQTYARAQKLCKLMGNPPELFPVLFGLGAFYLFSGQRQAALEVGEELLNIAQRQHDPELLLEAHTGLGSVFYHYGELAASHAHLEAGIALYDPHKHRSHRHIYGQDPGVVCLSTSALTLSLLVYADQALVRLAAALRLAREL
jgi:predicted ATPase